MKVLIVIVFIATAFRTRAQTDSIRKIIFLASNWMQVDESPTGLDTPQDAGEKRYRSNKLAFFKTGKWGSWLNNTSEFIVGDCKIKDGHIILYDLYAKHKGFDCSIIELTEKSLIISYTDLYHAPRKIKLIPF
jgi:hypothetical protein